MDVVRCGFEAADTFEAESDARSPELVRNFVAVSWLDSL
jgi:hypothetical protein